jgi:hypothetical protein
MAMQVSPPSSAHYSGIQSARGTDATAARARDASGEAGGESRPSASRRATTDAAHALTPQEQRQVAELQQIDRAVRAHEAAHIAAGGAVITSGADYSYTYGPDGRQYAVGGEVGIDTAPESDPADNIEKGIAIQAAALAPRDPSPQDYRVAGIGAQLESRGRGELARERADENRAAAGADPGSSGETQGPEDAREATRSRLERAYAASAPAAAPRIDTFA